MIDIAKMKVCRQSDVINMGSEGEGAVQDDTQTFDLRGGINSSVVNVKGETSVRFGQCGFCANQLRNSVLFPLSLRKLCENQFLTSCRQSRREGEDIKNQICSIDRSGCRLHSNEN